MLLHETVYSGFRAKAPVPPHYSMTCLIVILQLNSCTERTSCTFSIPAQFAVSYDQSSRSRARSATPKTAVARPKALWNVPSQRSIWRRMSLQHILKSRWSVSQIPPRNFNMDSPFAVHWGIPALPKAGIYAVGALAKYNVPESSHL